MQSAVNPTVYSVRVSGAVRVITVDWRSLL